MSTASSTNPVSDRLTIDLDGRRSSAGGTPSEDAGHYSAGYVKAIRMFGHNLRWKEQDWRDLYHDYSLRKWDTDANNAGFMAALWDMLHSCIDREHRRQSVTQARDRLKADLGPREFTLTYSPAWYMDDATAQDAMRVAIDKLSRYYKNEIHEFRAVGEYTKAGRSHVHCYYLLDGGRKITDKNFKRAWPHWDPRKTHDGGHQGGHHATIRNLSDFAGYVEKDLDDAWMNVHITKDADDDETSHGSRDSQELSRDCGTFQQDTEA